MDIPEEILTALKHVGKFFPTLVYVIFDIDGNWLYLDKYLQPLDFIDKNIDYDILKTASDTAYEDKNFPCLYYYNNEVNNGN